jgi:hypothetical protein
VTSSVAASGATGVGNQRWQRTGSDPSTNRSAAIALGDSPNTGNLLIEIDRSLPGGRSHADTGGSARRTPCRYARRIIVRAG